MNKKKQIEKMAKIIARRSTAFRNPNVAFMTTATKTAENLYNADYRKQSEGEWIERPDLQGFVCSNGCGEMLTEIEEGETLPKFCPNCGTKMKNGITNHEHVELLCKRLCRMKGGAE